MGVGSAEGLGPRPGLKELGRVNPIIADRPGKRTTPVVHSAPNVRVQRIRKPARDKPGTLERIDDDRLLDTREACPSSDKQRGFVTGPNLVGTTSPEKVPSFTSIRPPLMANSATAVPQSSSPAPVFRRMPFPVNLVAVQSVVVPTKYSKTLLLPEIT